MNMNLSLFRPLLRTVAVIFVLTVSMAVSCDKDEPVDWPDDKQPATPELTRKDFTATSTWSLIGTLSGSNWDRDFELRSAGDWHAAFDVAVTATDEFKFRQNRSWDFNFGAGASGSKTTVMPGVKIALTMGGGDMKIAAGTYDIYLAPEAQIAYILPAGTAFTHTAEGKVEGPGNEVTGTYDRNLAPENKRSGLTYQLNVYSFADSDGDGWGDFQGIIDHLDYLDDLGVTGIWMSPVNACQSYHGYDVTDYYSLNPKFGGAGATASQAEQMLQELIRRAREKNIDIYMDYVLNHSGDRHPWFISAKDPSSQYRSYYVFSSNPSADVAAGRVDNFAGLKDPGMGSWYTIAGGELGYKGRLHFFVDYNGSTMTVTVTETTQSAQSANTASPKLWIHIGSAGSLGLYQTGATTYEITLDVDTDWGFLIRTSNTSWDGGTKWGSDGTPVTFGVPLTLNNTTAADITFGGESSSYFASFSQSMPDLNYGKYTECENSPAFQDLAASADKWIRMGVAGLRLDAVMWIYQCNHSANARFLAKWYDHCNATWKASGGQGDFYMVGEAYDYNASTVSQYYKGLPSNFDFAYYGTLKDRINAGKGSDFASTVSGIYKNYQNGYNARLYSHSEGMYDAIKLTNHDENRAASDFGKHAGKVRLAGAVLLTSPGKPFVYQGEELGYWGVKNSGDEYVRTPIRWTKNGSVPSSALNGKVDNSMLTADISVEAQDADEGSLLTLYRYFAYARNTHPALATGTMEPVSTGADAVAAWYMTGGGEKVLVMHNFSAVKQTVTRSSDRLGTVIVSNGGPSVTGSQVTLPGYSSVVFLQ